MTSAEIQALIEEAKCFSCFGGSFTDLLVISLLNRISTAGSGTSAVQGQAGDYAGGNPTWTPTSDVALAYDTSTTPATQWIWYDGAWH